MNCSNAASEAMNESLAISVPSQAVLVSTSQYKLTSQMEQIKRRPAVNGSSKVSSEIFRMAAKKKAQKMKHWHGAQIEFKA